MPVDRDAAVRLLLDLRATGRTLPELPDGLRPSTLEEGYAIQAELHRVGGWGIGAIKVGATGLPAQRALGLDQPFGALVAAPMTFESGVVLDRAAFHHVPILESEFAMRLGVDVREPGDLPDDVRALIDAIAPSIELACSRFEPMLGASVPSLLADNGVSGALVLGGAVDPILALAEHRVVLRAGPDELATGHGGSVLGDPFRSLAWALRHELGQGRAVAAGTWVATGSCTGLTPCPLDTEVTADFGALGTVSLTVTS